MFLMLLLLKGSPDWVRHSWLVSASSGQLAGGSRYKGRVPSQQQRLGSCSEITGGGGSRRPASEFCPPPSFLSCSLSKPCTCCPSHPRLQESSGCRRPPGPPPTSVRSPHKCPVLADHPTETLPSWCPAPSARFAFLPRLYVLIQIEYRQLRLPRWTLFCLQGLAQSRCSINIC